MMALTRLAEIGVRQAIQGMTMRELDREERDLLATLDEGVSTVDLIAMVRDMGDILRSRGHVVQANVAELAADRLAALHKRDGDAVPLPSNARPDIA